MFSRSAELQDAQSKLDSLETTIATATVRLLQKQADELERARIEPLMAINEENERLRNLRKQINVLLERQQIVIQETNVLRTEQGTAKELLDRTKSEHEIVREQLEVGKLTVKSLSGQKAGLELDVSRLEEQKANLNTEIAEQGTRLADVKEKTQSFQTTYDALVVEKEESIKVLDAKLLERASKLEQGTVEIDAAMSDIASRTKLLDIRDQNLRIREQKVEQGETKLIQNSNLLNI